MNDSDPASWDTMDYSATQKGAEAVILAKRYRVIRKLGEGGMGTVWLAADIKLDDRPVAIKMLPAILSSNPRGIRQLKQEAKLAMQLSHPHIVTLRAFEEEDGNAFLVMDYVEGQTLEQLLAARETLSVDEVIRLFTPIAAALDYAHSQKVVHRDIKPSNILIRKDGTPFITDFGVAREMKDTMTRVTGKSTSGTLPYMSPEQLRGESPAPGQDIYSLAATMYECLAGNPPFYRGQIEYQIVNEEPEPLQTSSPLGDSVMKGLSKDTRARGTRAQALLTATNNRPVPQAAPQPASRIPDGFVMEGRDYDPASRLPMAIRHEKTGYILRLVPAGEFFLGSPAGEGLDRERPRRRIHLDAYWIGETPVTCAQFVHFLNERGNQTEGGVTWVKWGSAIKIYRSGNSYRPKSGMGDHPVVEVSWYGARAFAQSMGGNLPSRRNGKRLPGADAMCVGRGATRGIVVGPTRRNGLPAWRSSGHITTGCNGGNRINARCSSVAMVMTTPRRR